MNKKILIFSILSLGFVSNFVFAANWKAPAGYEKITSPSSIKYYSNIIKAPNGIDLYGKKIVVNNNKNNNAKIKYLDKDVLLYYKGLLVQGSVDKAYYYVATPDFIYNYSDSCKIYEQIDVCIRNDKDYKKTYTKFVSNDVIKANNINTSNIVVVDQKDINNSISQLPFLKNNNISVINNYKVCDFNNIASLLKDKNGNTINYIAYVSAYDGENGTRTGDLAIANLIDTNCLKEKRRLQAEECMKFSSNGYNRLSAINCSGANVGSCVSVYEKNNEFYIIASDGGYMEPANTTKIYKISSINNICK